MIQVFDHFKFELFDNQSKVILSDRFFYVFCRESENSKKQTNKIGGNIDRKRVDLISFNKISVALKNSPYCGKITVMLFVY